MHMHPLIEQKFTHWKQNGTLIIAAALLFELLTVLWIGFFILFSLETLLPTFVTIRLSLTNLLAFLILATLSYLFLERQLDEIPSQTKTPRWLAGGVWFFGFILIALSLARFPLFGALLFLTCYLLLAWILSKFVQEK